MPFSLLLPALKSGGDGGLLEKPPFPDVHNNSQNTNNNKKKKRSSITTTTAPNSLARGGEGDKSPTHSSLGLLPVSASLTPAGKVLLSHHHSGSEGGEDDKKNGAMRRNSSRNRSPSRTCFTLSPAEDNLNAVDGEVGQSSAAKKRNAPPPESLSNPPLSDASDKKRRTTSKSAFIGRSSTSLGAAAHDRDRYSVEGVYARHEKWLRRLEKEKALDAQARSESNSRARSRSRSLGGVTAASTPQRGGASALTSPLTAPRHNCSSVNAVVDTRVNASTTPSSLPSISSHRRTSNNTHDNNKTPLRGSLAGGGGTPSPSLNSSSPLPAVRNTLGAAMAEARRLEENAAVATRGEHHDDSDEGRRERGSAFHGNGSRRTRREERQPHGYTDTEGRSQSPAAGGRRSRNSRTNSPALSRTTSGLAGISRTSLYPPDADFDFIERFEERLRQAAERNTEPVIQSVIERKFQLEMEDQKQREEIAERKDALREKIYADHQSVHERKHLAELGLRGTQFFPMLLAALFIAKCREALRVYHSFDIHRRLLAPILARKAKVRKIREERKALTERRLAENPVPSVEMLRATGGNPKENFFASWSDRDVNFFISLLAPKSFNEGEVVMHAGDMDRVMYIITRGTVEVQIKKRTGHDKRRNNVGAQCFPLPTPTYVGEFALLCREPRGATIMCKTDVDSWCIERNNFEKVLATLGPWSVNALEEVANNRRKSNMLRFFPLKEDMVREVLGFKHMCDAQIKDLVKAAQPHVLRNHTVYLSEDEYRPEITFLSDGCMELTKPSDPHFAPRRYTKGFAYGVRETIFSQESSPFQVKVVDGGAELWIIPRQKFMKVCAFYPGSVKEAAEILKDELAKRLVRGSRVPRFVVNDPYLRHVLLPPAMQQLLWSPPPDDNSNETLPSLSVYTGSIPINHARASSGAIVTPCVYSHGDVLIQEGQSTMSMFIVMRGTVEIRHGANMSGNALAIRDDEITADPELGGVYSHRSAACTNLAQFFPSVQRILAPRPPHNPGATDSAGRHRQLSAIGGGRNASVISTTPSPAAAAPEGESSASTFVTGPKKRATGSQLPWCPPGSMLGGQAALTQIASQALAIAAGGSAAFPAPVAAGGAADALLAEEEDSPTNGEGEEALTLPPKRGGGHSSKQQHASPHSSPAGSPREKNKKTSSNVNKRAPSPPPPSNSDADASPLSGHLALPSSPRAAASVGAVGGINAALIDQVLQQLCEVGFVVGSFEFAARRGHYASTVRCLSYCEVLRIDIPALVHEIQLRGIVSAVGCQPCGDMLARAWSLGRIEALAGIAPSLANPQPTSAEAASSGGGTGEQPNQQQHASHPAAASPTARKKAHPHHSAAPSLHHRGRTKRSSSTSSNTNAPKSHTNKGRLLPALHASSSPSSSSSSSSPSHVWTVPYVRMHKAELTALANSNKSAMVHHHVTAVTVPVTTTTPENVAAAPTTSLSASPSSNKKITAKKTSSGGSSTMVAGGEGGGEGEGGGGSSVASGSGAILTSNTAAKQQLSLQQLPLSSSVLLPMLSSSASVPHENGQGVNGVVEV